MDGSLGFEAAWELLRPPILFALAVGGYTALIFYLCHFMSRRDVFRFRYDILRKATAHSLARRLLLLAGIYVWHYVLIFPLVAYLWFLVLILIVASLYSSLTPASLIVISMSVLTAVRVTAYFNEDLSRDISRILPFALLGVFLSQLNSFEINATIALLEGTTQEWERGFYYWLFVIIQETVLRFVSPSIRILPSLVSWLWWTIRNKH